MKELRIPLRYTQGEDQKAKLAEILSTFQKHGRVDGWCYDPNDAYLSVEESERIDS